jgi:hypothetical protein
VFRDLRVGHFFKKGQLNHLALVSIQGIEGGFDINGDLSVDDGLVCRFRGDQVLQMVVCIYLGIFLFAGLVDKPVTRNAENPTWKASRSLSAAIFRISSACTLVRSCWLSPPRSAVSFTPLIRSFLSRLILALVDAA